MKTKITVVVLFLLTFIFFNIGNSENKNGKTIRPVKFKFDYTNDPSVNFIAIYGYESNNYLFTNYLGTNTTFTINISTPIYVRTYAISNNINSDLSNEAYSDPYLDININNTNKNYVMISVQPIQNQLLQIYTSFDLTNWFLCSTNNVLMERMDREKQFYKIKYLNN